MSEQAARIAILGVSILGCSPGVSNPVAPSVPVPVPTMSIAAPAPAAPPAPAASSPQPAAPPATCTDNLPPKDMVRDNIASTAMTGLAEIVASKTTSLDGKSPAPASGYVNVRYEVRVLRWFSGTGPEQLVLNQGAEAGYSPPGPGQLLFFSACSSAPGTGYEPDVGYFFPADPACRADLESLAQSAAKRGGTKRSHGACKK